MGHADHPARHWWESAVVYQLYVRSFADSDGDGVGDLLGIIERMPYLRSLGVDAVWLTPCFPSPQHDHGYDVADYFAIEPEYGSLDTFDALVATAQQAGIKVLLDIVPNHCSWDHAWFTAAVAAGPGSAERERFYFRDGRGPDGSEPPNNWRAVFGGPAWSRVIEPDGAAGQWYLHTFTPQQPDWNWSSAEVVDHFDRAVRFWFDRGVEGFRVDAVVVAGKAPGLPDAPPIPDDTRETDAALRNPFTVFRPEGHEAWKRWRKLVDGYAAEHPGRDVFLVAEAYTPRRPDLLLEYQNHEEFHQVFSFDLMLSPWNAPELYSSVQDTLAALAPDGLCPSWTLNNHDTQRSVTRYGRADAAAPGSWTGNNLTYTDTPIDLELGRRRSRAMALFLLALPGCVYLYQGEELGLPEVLDLPPEARQDPIFFRTSGREIGRDGCRVPLPWTISPDAAYGFSPAGSTASPWMPQPDGWGTMSAEAEAEAADRPDLDEAHGPGSFLSLYRRAIAARARLSAWRDDPLVWEVTDHPTVLAYRRGDVVVVLNAGADPVALRAVLPGEYRPILGSMPGPLDPHVIAGDAALWLVRTSG